MGKIKCPVCNSCMSYLYIDLVRYIYCGFCKAYRQGPNNDLHIVESPYKDKIESSKVDDPVENNEQEIPENG